MRWVSWALMILTIPLIGFAPDRDSNIPLVGGEGVWTTCDGFYPTARGFRRLKSPEEAYGALPTRVSPADDGACYGAYVARFLDGSQKLIVGTKTKLYLGSSGEYTDYSPIADYSIGDRDRWRFAMFGDDLIATNGNPADAVQVLPASGTQFVSLAGLPPCGKIVATVNSGGAAFVFLLNLSSSTPGNLLTPTMWWCSAVGNDASWTPDIATQCANGYLDDTPGEITGARQLGRNLITYKERAIYSFEYVAGSIVWAPRLVSTEAGALSQEAIVDLGDVHACMGFDNFYVVDSSGAPQAIDNPLRRFLFEEDLERNFAFAVQGRWDKKTNVVFWHYPSRAVNAAGTIPQVCDRWVAWHRESGRWTMGELDIEQLVLPELPSAPGLTYGDFGSLFSTWGAATGPYNSINFAGSSDVVAALIKPDHKLYSLTGTPEAGAYFRLADIGDGQQHVFVRRARPRFAIFPDNAGTSLRNYEKDNLGDDEDVGTLSYLDQDIGWFNFIANAKYHGFQVTFPAGDAEILSIDVDWESGGTWT